MLFFMQLKIVLYCMAYLDKINGFEFRSYIKFSMEELNATNL